MAAEDAATAGWVEGITGIAAAFGSTVSGERNAGPTRAKSAPYEAVRILTLFRD